MEAQEIYKSYEDNLKQEMEKSSMYFAKYKEDNGEIDENVIYEQNYGLLKILANRHRNIFNKVHGSFIDFDDIIQIGGYGLVNAIRTFDDDTGYTFSTYASRCIVNELYKEVKRRTCKKNFSEDITLTSMQAVLHSDEDDVNVESIIGDDDEEFISVEDREILDNILRVAKYTLSEEEYKLWYKHINGEPAANLAEEAGIKRTTMTMRLKAYRKRVVKAVESDLHLSKEDCI